MEQEAKTISNSGVAKTQAIFAELPDYAFEREIGSGGMAKVFLARSKHALGANPWVAIKTILPAFHDDKEVMELFRMEAHVSRILDHRNIVRAYDFIKSETQEFLVLEYVEGRTLSQIRNKLGLMQKTLPPSLVLYIAREVASALDYAYSEAKDSSGKLLNIIHRDISLRNIMITKSGDIKVLDFGIAKFRDRIPLTCTNGFRGTPKYAAPEQTNGGELDQRSDLFSLGVVLNEVLRPEAPEAVLEICNKCMRIKPEDRYQSAAELMADLDEVLGKLKRPALKREMAKIFRKIFPDDPILFPKKDNGQLFRMLGFLKRKERAFGQGRDLSMFGIRPLWLILLVGILYFGRSLSISDLTKLYRAFVRKAPVIVQDLETTRQGARSLTEQVLKRQK